ncbi:MAG: hypothetical protein V1800_05325 [Candidatus Latescibacterota bacterium]
MKLNDKVFDKWVCWARRIEMDLQEIVNNQQVYREFSRVVCENWEHISANEGAFFCEFVQKCYGVQAAVGVRRHLDKSSDCVSLRKLMDQIKMCAAQFTFNFYLERFPLDDDKVKWQKSTFSLFSHDGKVLAEDIVERDINEATNLGEQIRRFVNRELAHLGKKDYRGKLTLNDIEKSIDLFNQLACKYVCLLTGDGYDTLEPEILFDWTQVFRVPLDVGGPEEC